MLGINDTVVPNSWSIEFAKVQEASIKFFYDDHSFTNNIEKLPNIVKKIIE
jgi:hypothetical protein